MNELKNHIGLFETLEDYNTYAANHALIAARERAKSRFGKFVSVCPSRLELIDDEIVKMANEIAVEYQTNVNSVSSIYKAAIDELRLIASSDVETGDNYQQERITLPKADESGLGGPSPEVDKSVSGTHEKWNLPDIEIGSKRHQQETQVVTDEPDLHNPDFDPDSPVRTRQDIRQDVKDIVGERTKTWTDTKGLADPVTSS